MLGKRVTLGVMLGLGVVLGPGFGCTPSQEAQRVQLEVEVDDAALVIGDNDLGWRVELGTARIAVMDLQFSILGEGHDASAWLPSWLIGRAWAHPGHLSGGDVTGELGGEFILDWTGAGGMQLGTAEMLTGVYQGLNFGFRAAAGASDGLVVDDPLLGHTAHFAGTASKAGQVVMFTAQVDIEAGTQMVGAPFEIEVGPTSAAPVVLQLFPVDPVEGLSLFDGLDFAALDADGDGLVAIVPGEDAHNFLRRTLQSHVHYGAVER
ncbi:MAG: hypothetical protein H0T76_24040 [Nannocystis sp.]|nr:hypothetical protein [Nannocystis sp.]MBA3549559.1 hypothetical protein [Nannocystis sp.]